MDVSQMLANSQVGGFNDAEKETVGQQTGRACATSCGR